MKKRIISYLMAASMIFGALSMTGAAAEATLSPRASVEYDAESGYISGIVGIPTADYIAAQFDGEVAVTAPDGSTLTGEALVPADSAVIAGGAELAKVLVAGDASRDAKINLSDVTAVLQHIAKWDVAVSVAASDVNGDGSVNLTDVTVLLKYIAKWDIAISTPAAVNVITDGAAGLKLLANDAEIDAAFLQIIKDKTGIDIPVAEEIQPGEKYITVGADLCDKYDFIDKTAAEAVDDNKAYVDIYNDNVHVVATTVEGIEFAATTIADQYDGEDLVLTKGYAGPVTHMTERGRLYWGAVENIIADDFTGMNEDIAVAIANANYTAPKSIIYMIGDGMGKNIAVATKYMYEDQLYGGKLAMNYLPVEGRQSTYSQDDQVTDSAAGGTALATGFKTTNGTIAMNGDHTTAYKTLLELAAEQGKSTGIVATKAVTDATPAAFTAHVEERGYQIEIAGQQLSKLIDGSLDIILGGGSSYYDAGANAAARAAAKERGVTYTKDWDEASYVDLPLAGLFASEALDTHNADIPTVAEMTELALERLSEDENGFFLMVEGSQIDSYGHSNSLANEAYETYEFDLAVAAALRYVALNPDTVLVITADHETGGLSIPGTPSAENIRTNETRYSTSNHHWVDVPVYAVGYGTDALAGCQENTDIARFLAGFMSDEEFGQTSEVNMLIDVTDKTVAETIVNGLEKGKEAVTVTNEGIRANFGNGITHLYIPTSLYEIEGETLDTVSAIRVTYKNMGNEPRLLPYYGIRDENNRTSSTGERITYLRPGEEYTYTYVLPAVQRHNSMLSSAKDIILYTTAGNKIDVLITDISVVSRPFDK